MYLVVLKELLSNLMKIHNLLEIITKMAKIVRILNKIIVLKIIADPWSIQMKKEIIHPLKVMEQEIQHNKKKMMKLKMEPTPQSMIVRLRMPTITTIVVVVLVIVKIKKGVYKGSFLPP